MLLTFWLALCGRIDPGSVVIGLICCAFVTWFNVADSPRPVQPPMRALKTTFRLLAWAPVLLARFVFEMVSANIQVARLVLHPRMPIEPRVIRFRTKLRGTSSRVMLANAITLTPGTLTLDIQGDEFVVHCISAKAANDVSNWVMEDMLARMEMMANGESSA
ncbi:MAG: Na+/H+ antiporter subunit E [Firmicutes bacterium]|nr:Na+/H+ antiporter subunit E [Bacillota bacterium]